MSRSSWMKNAKWSIWSWGENGAHAESRFGLVLKAKRQNDDLALTCSVSPGRRRATHFALLLLGFSLLSFSSLQLLSFRAHAKGRRATCRIAAHPESLEGEEKKKTPKERKNRNDNEWRVPNKCQRSPLCRQLIITLARAHAHRCKNQSCNLFSLGVERHPPLKECCARPFSFDFSWEMSRSQASSALWGARQAKSHH